MAHPLTADEVSDFCARHPGWICEGSALVRRYEAPTFADGIAVVVTVAGLADRVDHHPDIDIRWRTLTFRLSTHSAGGVVTDLDTLLAESIDSIVGRAG